MGVFGPYTMSGDGSVLIDGGAVDLVLEIDVQLATPAAGVDYYSLVFPERLLHAGWVALTALSGQYPFIPPFTPYVTWWKYLEFKQEAIGTMQTGLGYADTLFWHFPSCAVIASVYW